LAGALKISIILSIMVSWLLGKSELLRVVRASLSLLSKRDQKKIKLVALIQIFLSFLEDALIITEYSEQSIVIASNRR